MKKVLSFLLSITLLLSASNIVFAGALPIKVGICADFPPFEYIENGELKGFDIEFMQLIGNGWDIQFENMSFSAMMEAVANNHIDCAISAIVPTDERKMSVNFTTPYITCNRYDENGSYLESYAIATNNNHLQQVFSNRMPMYSDEIAQLANKYGLIYNNEGYYECGSNFNEEIYKSEYSGFIDVPTTHWAYQYIQEMTDRGVLNGYNENEFGPDDSITRGQFATIMCRAAQLDAPYINSTSYEDVHTDDWFAPYVESAKYYLSGYISDGKKYYKPNENAVREDIAVALVKLKGYSTTDYNEEELKAKFTDWQSISQDARKYIYSAIKNNLISGYEDNTFRGQASITRAEAATLFYRAYQFGNDNKIFEKETFDEPTPTVKPIVKPTQQPIENNNEPLHNINIQLSANSDNFEVNTGETVEIKITANYSLANIHLAGYDVSISGDTDILSSVIPHDKQEIDKTEFSWTTKELNAGKYRLNCEVGNASKTIKINVKEPEPEYTYEVTTITTDINGEPSSIVAANNGVYYTLWGKRHFDGCDTWYDYPTSVYFVSNKGVSKTISQESFKIILDDFELTKAEKATAEFKVYALGVNHYNNKAYAIIYGMQKYWLYNLTDNTVEREVKEKESYHLPYSHGEIYFIEFDEFNDILCYTNDGRWDYRETYIDDTWYNWKNLINQVDYYIPYNNTIFACDGTKFYSVTDSDENLVYSIDTDGNETLLFGKDDIKRTDRRPFDKKVFGFNINCHAVSENGVFYFYDTNYECIRMISKIK